MKVLYVTAPSFFDLEISLIRELSKFVDVDVLTIVNTHSQHSSAFSILDIGTEVQLINANDHDAMKQYKNMIDLNRWNLAICPKGNFTSLFKMAQLMYGFMDAGNYDIIHNTTYSKELLFVLPKISGYKNRIMTIHDPIPHDKLSILNKIREYIYQKVFNNKILLSNALLDDYVKYTKTPYDNIYISRLGVYDFLTKYELKPNLFGEYILFFGRIAKYKGVELLIEAYKKTQLFNDGIKLIIAGKGLLECDIPDERDGIIMINRYIENKELASLIYHSRFIVLPYRSATQSGCVMSAFAFNKPILVTNVGDLPKEVENNVTGLVVEANNVDALKNGLCNINDSNLLTTLSTNIEKKYSEDSPYSWKSAANKIYKAYNSIMNN